jgi:hypothetical protein
MTTNTGESRRIPLRAALCVALTASGCGPVEPLGTPGALKAGGFTYCDTSSNVLGDQACTPSGSVPDRIAVGSTFRMSFSATDSSETPTLSSSDSNKLEMVNADQSGDAGFQVVAAGSASVEARLPSKDTLLDFVQLELVDVESLALRICPRGSNAFVPQPSGFVIGLDECGGKPAGDASVEISRGASVAPTVCAFPVDGAKNDLAGHFEIAWTVDDGSTAKLEMFVANDGTCATIGGLTLGTAPVTVTAGTLSTVLDVTVNE